MARFHRLRRTLQALVFASLPASASISATGCCGGYQDPTESQQLFIEPDGVAYGALVKECRNDDLACTALCEKVLQDQGVISYPGEVYFTECRLIEDNATTAVHMTYAWPDGCVGGRRPQGLAACAAGARRAESSAVGAWLSHMAFLEAAAVPAFVRTADQLERLGAPGALVERALASAEDEVKHTLIMAALARAHGVSPRAPALAPSEALDVFALCLENAVEGCVRETFGAVVATWQAHMAQDPRIRAAMREIAPDETAHAELSADIHDWAMAQLDPAQRALVRERMHRAVAELRASVAEPVAPELIRLAGLPGPAESLALIARLESALW